jgi:hypothetical protein
MEQYIILIDSHVHIYDCFKINKFFESALTNFKYQNQKIGPEKFIGILFLTETRDNNYFAKLKENYFQKELLDLNLKQLKNSETQSLVYQNGTGNYLVIISGKQIVTSEKLEVLALGTIENLNYGDSLIKSIEKIESIGAIPVLPWGVGKWTGKRKRVLENLINSEKSSTYFLGDNSGRLSFWPVPKLFKIAENKGIITLRGSDPLPINSQEKKAGSFGFYINTSIDLENPAKEISKVMFNIAAPNNFGKMEAPLNFFKNQILMQVRKKF